MKNKDGEKQKFNIICLFKHRWSNSSDKNRWAVWRCKRCNKIDHILGSAPE